VTVPKKLNEQQVEVLAELATSLGEKAGGEKGFFDRLLGR